MTLPGSIELKRLLQDTYHTIYLHQSTTPIKPVDKDFPLKNPPLITQNQALFAHKNGSTRHFSRFNLDQLKWFQDLVGRRPNRAPQFL